MSYISTIEGEFVNPALGVWGLRFTDRMREFAESKYEVVIQPLDFAFMPVVMGKAERRPILSTKDLDWMEGHRIPATLSTQLCTDGELYWFKAISDWCDMLRRRAKVGEMQRDSYRVIVGYVNQPKLVSPLHYQERRCPVLSLSQPRGLRRMTLPSCGTPLTWPDPEIPEDPGHTGSIPRMPSGTPCLEVHSTVGI